MVEWTRQGKITVLGEKPVPVPTFLPQIPQRLALGLNSSLYGNRPAWIMARPLPFYLIWQCCPLPTVHMSQVFSYTPTANCYISISHCRQQWRSSLSVLTSKSYSQQIPSLHLTLRPGVCNAMPSPLSFHPIYLHVFSSCSWSICSNIPGAVSLVFKQMSSTLQGVVLRIWKPFPHP